MRDPYGPPTERQLNFAKKLGIEIPDNITKIDLSLLIDETKNSIPPTADQLALAKVLEIDIGGMNKQSVGWAIDAELNKRGQAAMRKNPQLRAGKQIIYNDNAYEITFIGTKKYGHSKRCVAQLKPVYKGRGKAVTVAVTTIADAKPVSVIRRNVG